MKTINMVCVDTLHPEKSINVMNHMLDIFGHRISDNILFTDQEYNTNRINIKKIDKINNLQEYSKFVIEELPKYIFTDFCMIVQHDGYIINPELWTEDFLKYDYIGAPWKESTIIPYDVGRVGNGGFSIRSLEIMGYAKSLYKYRNNLPEDIFMSYILKNYNGCDFYSSSPIELASKFSFEYPIPEREYSIDKCFGFHDFKVCPELKENYKI